MAQKCKISPLTICFNKPWAGATRKMMLLSLLGCCKLVFQRAAGQAARSKGRLAYVWRTYVYSYIQYWSMHTPLAINSIIRSWKFQLIHPFREGSRTGGGPSASIHMKFLHVQLGVKQSTIYDLSRGGESKEQFCRLLKAIIETIVYCALHPQNLKWVCKHEYFLN